MSTPSGAITDSEAAPNQNQEDDATDAAHHAGNDGPAAHAGAVVGRTIDEAAATATKMMQDGAHPIMEAGKNFIPDSAEEAGQAFGDTLDTSYEALSSHWQKKKNDDDDHDNAAAKHDAATEKHKMNSLLDDAVRMTLTAMDATQDAATAATRSVLEQVQMRDVAAKDNDNNAAATEKAPASTSSADAAGGANNDDDIMDAAARAVELAAGFTNDRVQEVQHQVSLAVDSVQATTGRNKDGDQTDAAGR